MTGDVPSAELALDEQNPTSPVLEPAPADALLPAPVPQQGWFGFTLRELIIGGAWALAFVFSFVPGAGSVLDGSATVWTMNGAWVLAIGVPTVAVFLLALRRLSPEGIRRVGSLGIDQFASVAFSVALVTGAVLLWQQLDLVAATRRSPLITWPLWLETLLMLALVVVTVFAPLIPGIRDDFEHRTETLAHRNANPVRPVFTRPRPVAARGSISDPQNDDDVDPGLEHENEVAARGHLSATGVTGAVVQGVPGYVPAHHRSSFRATAQEGDEAPVPGSEHSDHGGAEAVADSAGRAAPAPDALTEAIPDAFAAPRQNAESSSDSSRTHADEPVPAPAPTSPEGSPATTATGPGQGGDGGLGPRDQHEGIEGSDADPASDPAPAHSDTLTEVLGELLEPAPDQDTATQEFEAAARDEGREDAGSATPDEQPQPFWALAPEKRAVHDARGDEIFTIGPDAWILVLEDRGGAFVVRHDDGRVGYLHDTENMTRG